jgi:molecular chaperone DnaJ
MARPDFYQVLGIQPTASLEQIKAAYRRQAIRHHPDRNPGSDAATERFRLCNDAYQVLSDPKRRIEYDSASLGLGVSERVGGLIDELLGTKRKRRRAGRNVTCSVEISMREAAAGVTRSLCFSVQEPCPSCRGSGAAPGGTKPCEACGGRGESKAREGIFSLPRPCPRCGGQGKAIVTPCPACGAVGALEKQREYSVKLPPGVRNGDVKVVTGEGEPGIDGGAPGDLHIKIRVASDPLLTVEGRDLLVEVPVALADVALGTVVDVPTLEGVARMKVPAGTPSGKVFRLKGKGFAHGSLRGDLLARIQVETPVSLGEDQRRLLLAFTESCTEEMLPLRGSFRTKIAGRG